MADRYVPPERLLPGRSLAPCEIWDNPTYRNPTHAVYNKSAVALGVCRGAIDNFIELAKGKTPWGLGSKLKELPVVQYRIGEAQAASAKVAKAAASGAQAEATAQTESAATDGKLTRLEVPELQARYLEVVGQPTG